MSRKLRPDELPGFQERNPEVYETLMNLKQSLNGLDRLGYPPLLYSGDCIGNSSGDRIGYELDRDSNGDWYLDLWYDADSGWDVVEEEA